MKTRKRRGLKMPNCDCGEPLRQDRGFICDFCNCLYCTGCMRVLPDGRRSCGGCTNYPKRSAQPTNRKGWLTDDNTDPLTP